MIDLEKMKDATTTDEPVTGKDLSTAYMNMMSQEDRDQLTEVSSKVKHLINDSLKDTREKLREAVSKMFEAVEEYINQFESEEQVLTTARAYVESVLSETRPDSLQEEDAYTEYAETLGHSSNLRYMREACYRNGWSADLLRQTIAETINEKYPALTTPTFIFIDEADGSISRLDFNSESPQIRYRENEEGATEEADNAQLDFHLFGGQEENEQLSFNFPASTDEEMLSYVTTQLETYFFPTDKISNNLTEFVDGIQRPVGVEKKSSKKSKDINTLVTIQFDEIEEELEGTKTYSNLKKLTKFDQEVFNALLTLHEHGERVTTFQKIQQIINKNLDTRLTGKQETKKEAILESLKRLNSCTIDIDATAEADSWHKFDEFRANMYGRVVSVFIVTAYVNGTLVTDAIQFDLSLSPLYRYAKTRGQIASVPFKYLEPNINRTDETRRIENYLLRRAEAIPNISNIVLIETILNEAGIYEEDYKNWKDKKKKSIDKIIAILEGWKRTKYIKGYGLNKKSRSLYSITILK